MTMASLYYWHYGFAVIFVDLRRTRIIRLLYVPDQPRKYVIKQLFPSKHAASQMTSSCKCPIVGVFLTTNLRGWLPVQVLLATLQFRQLSGNNFPIFNHLLKSLPGLSHTDQHFNLVTQPRLQREDGSA